MDNIKEAAKLILDEMSVVVNDKDLAGKVHFARHFIEIKASDALDELCPMVRMAMVMVTLEQMAEDDKAIEKMRDAAKNFK